MYSSTRKSIIKKLQQKKTALRKLGIRKKILKCTRIRHKSIIGKMYSCDLF